MVNRKAPRGEASKRQLRVGEQVRHVLSEIFLRGELHDPRLTNATLTVTSVSLSPDLRNSVAFVVPLGGGNQDEIIAALNRSSKWLRGQIAKSLSLKYSPELTFRLDGSFDHASRIQAILDADHSREPDTHAAGKAIEDGNG